MFRSYARIDGTVRGTDFSGVTTCFTNDTLVRPVLPRLMPLGGYQHGVNEKREAEAQAQTQVQVSSGSSSHSPQKRPKVAQNNSTRPDNAEQIVRPLSKPPVTKHTKMARRREQCRTNQARYRERQKRRTLVKEEEGACLREHASLLQVQLSFWRTKPDRDAFTQYIVVELFRRFRNGLSGARPTVTARPTDTVTTSRSRSVPPKRHIERNLAFLKQVAFLRTVIASDVDAGHGIRGIDALLEQCWRFSVLHSDVQLDLLGVKRESNSDSQTERVTATGTLSVGVSEQTLADVFPGLPSNLRSKLQGVTLSYSLRVYLEFEETSMAPLLQVTHLLAELDVVSALMSALRDTSDVEQVMRHARISSSGFINEHF